MMFVGISWCVMETLSWFLKYWKMPWIRFFIFGKQFQFATHLTMYDDCFCTVQVTISNGETVLDFHWCTFWENFGHSLFKKQVTVGVSWATSIAGFRQMLNSFRIVAFRTFVWRDWVAWLTSAQFLFWNQISQTKRSKIQQKWKVMRSEMNQTSGVAYSKLIIGLPFSLGALSFESSDSTSNIHEHITPWSILAKSVKYADIISWNA